MELSETPLAALAERVASSDPAPGAGPSAAWTCTLAAALVEMVSAVAVRKGDGGSAAEARRDRAAALRAAALELAERDVAAYGALLALRRRRDEPGHGERLRAGLSDAAEPPLAIAETAAEVARLAADAAIEARGAVRGEAVTAATLAEAVVRAAGGLVAMNLAGVRDDPRPARAEALAESARGDLARAHAA